MEQILNQFETVTLQDIAQVSLMNRVDSKFLMNISTLQEYLTSLVDSYYIVEIDNELSHPYRTIYFDTKDLQFYHEHHNGKLNRTKIRSRIYENNGMVFNEIKQKSNKGKTRKSRIERETLIHQFDTTFANFAEEKECNIPESLVPQMTVAYNRITLVDKEFTERMTIDLNLTFEHNDKSKEMENLVIVELKRDKCGMRSTGQRELRNHGSIESGFSKYCIGVATLHNDIKKNNFKRKIRTVNKLCRTRSA